MNVRFSKLFYGVLLILIVTGCDKIDYSASSNQNEEIAVPIELDDELVNNINWNLTGTFNTKDYTLRGIPNKIGFIDAPFESGKTTKYMWHFWGEISNGNFTVIALKKGVMTPTPVLVESENNIWSVEPPLGPNNGADAHLPTLMEIPEAGQWALMVYIGQNYIDTIVVEAK